MEWTIKDKKLVFLEECHEYFYDGEKLPSVTEIIKRRFPMKYADVPDEVLLAAAEKGKALHKIIEKTERENTVGSFVIPEKYSFLNDEWENYKTLKIKHDFLCLDNEFPVVIPFGKQIVAAGTVDMMLGMNGAIGIADIKRTSKLDKDMVAYQLSLYALGLEYCYDVQPEFLKCVWLRGKKKQFADIPFLRDEAYDLLAEIAIEKETAIADLDDLWGD